MGSGTLKPGWTRVAFGDVVRLCTERTSARPAEGFERCVGLEHLDPGNLAVRRWGDVADGTTFTTVFRPGQVLFGKRRAYQRKVAVPDFSGVCSGDIYVLESGDDRHLLPDLLPFVCQTDSFFDHAIGTSAGSLSPRTNWRSLAAYEFALPPLDEQRRLAKLLLAVEAASRALQDARAALTALRKSTLMDSFGQLLADPAVRRVPVGQVGEVLLGRQRAPQHEDGPSMRPYLRAANVFDGYIDTADVKSMNFSSSEYRRYSLQDGDILLNEGQSRELVGRSAIFRGEVPDACFQNTLVRLRPSPSILSPYAHRYFQYCMYAGTFAAVAKQTTSIAHLGVQSLADLLMPLPGKNRQLEFSRRLSAIDSALPTTAEREERLRTLKALVSEPFRRESASGSARGGLTVRTRSA